ncbi:MAG: hypothetical protein P4L72_00990 [Parvibaculum sp.]|jgi:hypothetical protein|uniref:hypothetical protein n=1 Tax=Parvibaculum sp. TaxID=2024848 RepID=UPI00285105D8|nr:hypothetical protein [Parvibaculum sp.]MDR3497781.1 hypothetical protein [Parvibaculum sp.]
MTFSRTLFANAIAGFALAMLAAGPVAAGAPAKIEGGTKLIKQGETAQFPIVSSASESSDFHAACDVETGGRASLTFDGEHYIPLSEPAVGDIVTLAPGEARHYDLTGTVEANKGDAYIAFSFTGVPQAMCFPGEQCGGAAGGAQNVKVTCKGS